MAGSQQVHEESFTLDVVEGLILTLISCAKEPPGWRHQALLELDPGHLLIPDVETLPDMGPMSQST